MKTTETPERCPFCGSDDVNRRSVATVECVACDAVGTHHLSAGGIVEAGVDWTDGAARRRARAAFDDERHPVESGG